jgi:hypothetical protein
MRGLARVRERMIKNRPGIINPSRLASDAAIA